jgi:succinoglycan biosynthesis protein ExoO
MLDADERFRIEHAALLTRPVRRALDWRRRTILEARAFDDLVAGLRARSGGAVLSAVAARPSAALRLRTPILDRARRHLARTGRRAPGVGARPVACVISRQRVVGATNGSSAYLLALAEGLAAIGYEVRFVSPSPATFGSWPALLLRPEMSVFRSVAFRGGIGIGSIVVATDARTLWRAMLGGVDRALARIGSSSSKMAKAPYAVALPWSEEDLVFVATYVRGASVIVADYAFGTEAIPYAIGHDRSLVIMHDLFSSMRAGSLVEPITVGAEMRMLARADATIAIQDAEAAVVRAHLPGRTVALIPMPADPVRCAQPGLEGRLLFVGSDTAPNREGVGWFLDEVWPLIRAGRPDAVLDVAGSVCAAIAHRAGGVRLHGRVDRLDALYRDAAVVISPLKIGTGLKIKLVEALAQGKALVATSATLQGIEDCAGDAVRWEDEPQRFASATVELLNDLQARLELGERGLAFARRRFGRAACLDTLNSLLSHPSAAPTPEHAMPVLVEEDA